MATQRITRRQLATTGTPDGTRFLRDDMAWAVPGGGGGGGVGVHAYHTSYQAISANTWTALTLDAETYDSDGFHDNVTNPSRLVVPSGKGGLYLAYGQARTRGLDPPSAGYPVQMGLHLWVNGAAITGVQYQTCHFRNSANQPDGVTTIALLSLAVADYVELYIYHSAYGNNADKIHAGMVKV